MFINEMIDDTPTYSNKPKDPVMILKEACPQTREVCLAAVQYDGRALKWIHVQTPEICLAAVMKTGKILPLVKDKTPAICLAAVRQNGMALEHVKRQTLEICQAAVNQNPWAARFVDKKQFQVEFNVTVIKSITAEELLAPETNNNHILFQKRNTRM